MLRRMLTKIWRTVTLWTTSPRIRDLTRRRVRHYCEDRFLVVSTCKGDRMRVNPRLYSDYGIFFFGEYDSEMTAFMVSHLRAGMVSFDVGACHGYFTLLMARATAPDGVVYSFEPLPANHRRVLENTELNGLTNVVLSELALCDREGRASFAPPSDDTGLYRDAAHRRATGNNPGAGFLTETAGGGTVEVECSSLDRFVQEHGVDRMDLIKIDVEGAELDLLRGATCLKKFRPVVLIEFNYATCRRSGYLPEDLFVALQDYGYRLHWFRKGVLQPFTRQDLAAFRCEGDVANIYAFGA